MARICHLSTVHKGLDVRIYFKQCVTLAAAGYDTHLVISASPDDCKSALANSVYLHPLPQVSGRFSRFFLKGWKAFRICRKINADLYHFHDLELAPYALFLSFIGKKVIYDVHENVPAVILTKRWIHPALRGLIASFAEHVEFFLAKFFCYVVAATPFIAGRFRPFALSSIDINNYPILCELVAGTSLNLKQPEVCYVGGIAQIRGIVEVVGAMELLRSSVRLNLAGCFTDATLERRLQDLPGWQRVNNLGFLNRQGVRDVLSRSRAGLVTLHPATNYIDALPVKMFEYMSAGIPVIASDFPLWRDIVAGNDCGLLVDPLQPSAIAEAIDYLITHPEEADRMGHNGRRAVENQYNWEHEGQKLVAFYNSILTSRANS